MVDGPTSGVGSGRVFFFFLLHRIVLYVLVPLTHKLAGDAVSNRGKRAELAIVHAAVSLNEKKKYQTRNLYFPTSCCVDFLKAI